MKNELTLPNKKRNGFLALAVSLFIVAATGLIAIGVSFDGRYVENFTEITATVKSTAKGDKNERFYIYTEEESRPFALPDVYRKAIARYEALEAELPAGTTITVSAANADIYDTRKNHITVCSLKAAENEILSLEKGVGLQRENLKNARIVGVIHTLLFSAAATFFLILRARESKEKKVDLFKFLGTFSVGPQARERRVYNACVCVFVFLICAALIPSIILVAAGKEYYALILAGAMTIISLSGAIFLAVRSASLKKAEINYYDELFSFSPEVLPPKSSDVFPFFQTKHPGSNKLCKFSENGVNLIDYTVYFRFDPEVGITDGSPITEIYEGEKAFAEYKETPCISQNGGVFISYDELNFRTVALYGNKATRMTVIIASDFDPQKYGMECDICFLLDGYMYLTLKKYGVNVRGLETALSERKEKMLAASRGGRGCNGPFFYD